MRKPLVLLVLSSFMLPYARAPLCQAGEHEHEEPTVAETDGMHAGHDMHGGEHHPAPPAEADHLVGLHSGTQVVLSGEPVQDCHERMMCDAAADRVLLPAVAQGPTTAPLPALPIELSGALIDRVDELDLPPPRLA